MMPQTMKPDARLDLGAGTRFPHRTALRRFFPGAPVGPGEQQRVAGAASAPLRKQPLAFVSKHDVTRRTRLGSRIASVPASG